MKSFQFCLLCTRTIFKSTHTISKPRYTPTSFTKLFYARKLTEPSNTKKKKKTKVEIPVSTTDEDISKHFEISEQERIEALKLIRSTESIKLPEEGERLNKYLARLGICSRRQAYEAIKQGKVSVDGNVVSDVGFKITSPNQKIIFDGVVVNNAKIRQKFLRPHLYAYRKPVGVMCTRHDPEGRPTVYDELAKQGFNHLMLIGRLDFNSEGLLLLTNDGDLARYMALPESNIERVYLVRVRGNVTQQHLDKIKRGSLINDVHYGKIEATLKEQKGKSKHTWVEVRLWEGKNREIRKVFEHMGMPVSRLIRIQYGPYKLGKMKRNNIKELKITPELLKHCNPQWLEYVREQEQSQQKTV